MQELYIIYTETHENKLGTYTALKYGFPTAKASFLIDLKLTWIQIFS